MLGGIGVALRRHRSARARLGAQGTVLGGGRYDELVRETGNVEGGSGRVLGRGHVEVASNGHNGHGKNGNVAYGLLRDFGDAELAGMSSAKTYVVEQLKKDKYWEA